MDDTSNPNDSSIELMSRKKCLHICVNIFFCITFSER
jgi:hypothetical protein